MKKLISLLALSLLVGCTRESVVHLSSETVSCRQFCQQEHNGSETECVKFCNRAMDLP
jgi:hypothetical protein